MGGQKRVGALKAGRSFEGRKEEEKKNMPKEEILFNVMS